MSLRSMAWRAVATLFLALNLGGAVYAIARSEILHAGIHVGLLLLVGAHLMRQLAPRRADAISASSREFVDRLANLEQSVDAVAIEVERMGEGQRFITRFFADRGTRRAAEPVGIEVQQAAPHAGRE